MADTQIAQIKDYLWPIDCIYEFRNVTGEADFPAKVFGGTWVLLETRQENGYAIQLWKRTA